MHARIVFVATTEETASLGIGKALLATGKFSEVHGDYPYDVYQCGDCLLVWEAQTLAADEEIHWEAFFSCDCFIILYRHSGRGGKKRLTVHPQGNFSDKPLAGRGRSIAYAHALYQRHMLSCLENVVEGTDYQANYEVTHHGPTRLSTPVMFTELGDGEEQWCDEEGQHLVAQAVLQCIASDPEDMPCVLGLGGEHYAERFERRTFSKGWAFGHMIPERDFKDLDEELLREVVKKNRPRTDFVVVDKRKKGTAEQREWMFKVIENEGIATKKI